MFYNVSVFYTLKQIYLFIYINTKLKIIQVGYYIKVFKVNVELNNEIYNI